MAENLHAVHQPSSVLQLLEDAAPGLGDAGERLMQEISAGYPGSLLEDPGQLIARAHVRPQTLDALSAAAGFRDFAEARHVAQATINRDLRTPDARYSARLTGRSSRSGAVDLLRRIADQDTTNVAATLRTLNGNGALVLAAQAVVAGRRRYVVAGRKSYAYAHLLGTDLQSFLRDVVVVDGLVNRPLDILPDITDADVAVCFSLRRYDSTALATARRMRAAGAMVVGITDDGGSELAGIADIALVVETASQSFVDSPTAVASTVHALATLAATRARGARARLTSREGLARQLGVYDEADGGEDQKPGDRTHPAGQA